MPPTVGKGMTRDIILWGYFLHWQDPLFIFSSICAGHHEMTWILLDGFFTNFYGHPSYKWVQDIPCALRTIFKNYHLHHCHLTISIASSGLPYFCKVIKVFIKGSKSSWASPLSTKASRQSLGSSASSAGSSTSSAKWWHQNPSLWVQGPCQLGTRCFKAPTLVVRDQGTAGETWWHQWHPMGPLQVHVGINDNFINNLPLCHWWQQLMLPL